MVRVKYVAWMILTDVQTFSNETITERKTQSTNFQHSQWNKKKHYGRKHKTNSQRFESNKEKNFERAARHKTYPLLGHK
jgi:hypothetical protein